MKLRQTLTALFVLAPTVLGSCNSAESSDWERVKAEDTVPAYESFLAKYPNGLHADEARAALEGADWKLVKKDPEFLVPGDNPEKIRARQKVYYAIEYLAKHPNGLHADEVRTALARSWSNSGDTLLIDPRFEFQVEPLIAILNDSDSTVRSIAASSLAIFKHARTIPSAVDPLIAALKDSDSGVRSTAASTLGDIGGSRAVEPLIAALKDSNSGVRSRAAYALEKIKERRAVEPLITALKDSDSGVQEHVAHALAIINDPRGADALLAALNKPDLAVITGAYSFFIEQGVTGSEEVLINALNRSADVHMAVDFFNSENSKLSQAGASWGLRHGYKEFDIYLDCHRGRWGKREPCKR